MPKKYYYILFLAPILMNGCSSEDQQTLPEQSSKPSIFSDQLKALEKAKKVEQVIQTEIDNRRQAIND